MMDGVIFSLLTAALIGVCITIGFMVTMQARVVQLQAEMLKCLALALAPSEDDPPQIVPLPDWRTLPPDAQLMMRQTLVKMLAEMDRDLPARH